MTIAACHISDEGVVLGADSTTTFPSPNGDGNYTHLDHAQKLFEVGPPGSGMAVVTWGMGKVGSLSHRTICARLGEQHRTKPFASMADAADGLVAILWGEYTDAYAAQIAFIADVNRRVKAGELAEDADEVGQVEELVQMLSGGYCLAGRIGPGEGCQGFEIRWYPFLAAPKIEELKPERPHFWGVMNFAESMMLGVDSERFRRVLESGLWTGTPKQLFDHLAAPIRLASLPIREAIDWIHSVITFTIRGIKFAHRPHFCGGAVEVAVITTDRPFRWVSHKSMDAAIQANTVHSAGGAK